MKKLIPFVLAAVVALLPLAPVAAQGMMGASASSSDHTVSEEAEGKAVWEKLQKKEVACADLSNDDYEVLGEYFMGLMSGSAHSSMNAMMVQMMGEEGEAQMHLLMGKRLSGCVPDADAPLALSSGVGMMGGTGMMSMMMGGVSGIGLRSGMMAPWSRQLSGGAVLGLGLWAWLWALVWFVNSVLLGVLLWALIKKFWKK